MPLRFRGLGPETNAALERLGPLAKIAFATGIFAFVIFIFGITTGIGYKTILFAVSGVFVVITAFLVFFLMKKYKTQQAAEAGPHNDVAGPVMPGGVPIGQQQIASNAGMPPPQGVPNQGFMPPSTYEASQYQPQQYSSTHFQYASQQYGFGPQGSAQPSYPPYAPPSGPNYSYPTAQGGYSTQYSMQQYGITTGSTTQPPDYEEIETKKY